MANGMGQHAFVAWQRSRAAWVRSVSNADLERLGTAIRERRTVTDKTAADRRETNEALRWLESRGNALDEDWGIVGAQATAFGLFSPDKEEARAMEYPDGFGRCVMCGADRNEACTIISGSDADGDQTGSRRPRPHGGRAQIGSPLEPQEGFVPVKDEPGYSAAGDVPVTEQIGVTPPPSGEQELPSDADVLQMMTSMGEAQVDDPDDTFQLLNQVPYIDAAHLLDARNGREVAHWILGRMDALGDACAVQVRLQAEHLGAVAAVLLHEGYAVAPYSGKGLKVLVIEVSPMSKSISLYRAYKAWRDSPAMNQR